MNIGNNCEYCNNGTVFEIAEGEQQECPKCRSTMIVEVKGINWKKIIIIVAAICLLGGVGFGIYSLFFNKEKTPTKINLDKTELTLKVGERGLIVPSAEPEGAKATFTFKVNSSTVQVTQGGELTARRKGKATITVKCEENPDIRAICKVTVEEEPGGDGSDDPKPVSVENLSFNEGDFTLKKGESKQLSITVSPENHTEALMCSSDDETIATIDGSLTVTAKKAGTTNIRITADKSGKTAVVKVTVEKPKDGENPPPGTGHYNLGWGTYSGPMSGGGKPHGFGGTITVKASHTIDLKKASGETVQVNPGDKIVSVKMENGQLRQGEIHFSNGTRRYLSGL